jgi:hypothetical protein
LGVFLVKKASILGKTGQAAQENVDQIPIGGASGAGAANNRQLDVFEAPESAE